MKNIVIVGFMGTGKTSVAKALSEDIRKKYVSTDELIEAREKKEIKEIFRASGEPYFRKIEKEVIKEVSARGDQVVDAGGGVVLDEENMEDLKRSGTVICLWADAEVIYERTYGQGHRPLLNVEDPQGKIKELLEYRRPFYEKADHHIETNDWDVLKIVGQIKRIVNEKGE